MGNFYSSMAEQLGLGPAHHRVLLLGLDSAGKTTLLYQLKASEAGNAIPTAGVNEDVKIGGLLMHVWDVGALHIPALWRDYCYLNTTGIIFMVDSTDQERMHEAQQTLANALDHEDLSEASLLIFANKQDLIGALSAPQVAESMGCTSMRNRSWQVQGCCATTGEGVLDGLKWLSGVLPKPSSS